MLSPCGQERLGKFYTTVAAKSYNINETGRKRENFIESYCVKITDIPIHLINQIKDQMKRREEWKNLSYLFLIRMDYTPRKLQSKLMRTLTTLTQMYSLTKEWKARLLKSLWKILFYGGGNPSKKQGRRSHDESKGKQPSPSIFRLEYN